MQVTGHITADGSRLYSAYLAGGQYAVIHLISPAAESLPAAIRFVLWGADGRVLASPMGDTLSWSREVPSTQNYFIRLEALTDADYTLVITAYPPGEVRESGYVADPLAFDYDPRAFHAVNPATDYVPPMTILLPEATERLWYALDVETLFPDTNLSEVFFTVASGPVTACTTPPDFVEEILAPVTSFYALTWDTGYYLSEAAAGNHYEQWDYRTVSHGKCYEVAYFVHSTNLANYPSGSVREYNAEIIMAFLTDILQSARWLPR